MGWTVIKIDEDGQEEKQLSRDFEIANFDKLKMDDFKLIKYLDSYGDSTFGRKQFDDLISDLKQLDKLGQVDKKQMIEMLELIDECKRDVHTYLKFIGD